LKIKSLPSVELAIIASIAIAVPVQAQSNRVTVAQTQPKEEIVQVTAVRLDKTSTGIAVILETARGQPLQAQIQTEGNAIIADISNAVLSGEGFRVDNPAAGISSITVTQRNANQIRVTVTSETGIPTAEVLPSESGLALEVTSEEAIELVVTPEQQYFIEELTTGTRTETPILEIPQAVQAVPEEIIDDRAATDLREALRNTSGITQGNTLGNTEDDLILRGFDQVTILRDGLRGLGGNFSETANLERIEVLQGPASVLFGSGSPGGVINLVTKKPLSDPFYKIQGRVGSESLFRSTIDLSGPLSSDRQVLYRLNGVFENTDGFRDFDQKIERVFLAPVISAEVDEQTDLILEFDYLEDERPFDRGLVAIGNKVADIPLDRVLGEPDDFFESEEYRARYRLEHRFNRNWTLRNAVQYNTSDELTFRAEPRELNEATGDLTRRFTSNDVESEIVEVQMEVKGQFTTGLVAHTVLLGVDFSHESGDTATSLGATPDTAASPINIFDPDRSPALPPDVSELTTLLNQDAATTRWGFFLQDQIDLTNSLILVLNGRLDILDQQLDQVSPILGDSNSSLDETVFSPRVGVVYQPTEVLSLYASFARSFQPNSVFSVTAAGEIVEPERGTQYEVGLKGNWLNGRLSTTLALFEITRTNVAVADPDAPAGSGFVIPIGEERSRGIGLDIVGEILPGWNIIASYSHLDAEVTESNVLGTEEGNRVNNVPRNSASLWTTYEIPNGDLQGLGFGLGFFFEGDREGDPQNTFELPSYFRTDAAVYYERQNWKAAINIQNLFDIDYFENTGNTRLRINPGEPFTILGTVSVEL